MKNLMKGQWIKVYMKKYASNNEFYFKFNSEIMVKIFYDKKNILLFAV